MQLARAGHVPAPAKSSHIEPLGAPGIARPDYRGEALGFGPPPEPSSVPGPVFSATTRNDEGMYFAALTTTVLGNITRHPHNYLITAAPIGFRIEPPPNRGGMALGHVRTGVTLRERCSGEDLGVSGGGA